MADKISFKNAQRQTPTRVNRKVVISIIIVIIVLLIVAFLLFSVLQTKAKQIFQQKEPALPMVPTNIKYMSAESGGKYDVGVDYIILKVKDDNIKVNGDGTAFYVDSSGNKIKEVENLDEVLEEARKIANADTSVATALSGLPEPKPIEERLKDDAYQSLLEALAARGITIEDFLKMLDQLEIDKDTALNGVIMEGATNVVDKVKDQIDALAVAKENNNKKEQEETSTPKKGVINDMISTVIDSSTGKSTLDKTTISDGITFPSWMNDDYSVPDSMNAILNSIAGATSSQSAYDSQNQQQAKEDWAKTQTNVEQTSSYLTKWDLAVGTIIPMTLITGLNTDLPGQIIAQVRQDVYDTLTGQRILIPRGTRMIANYNSAVTFGQNRVAIAWYQMITPDGFVKSLPGFPGIDSAGYTGASDKSSNHLLSLFTGAMFASLLDVGKNYSDSYADALANVGSMTYKTLSTLLGAGTDSVQTLGTKYAELMMNRQPTIIIRPGAQITMLVTQNINMKRR